MLSVSTSQWMRFFTVFGSGTGANAMPSNGAPGIFSTQLKPSSASVPNVPPSTSAHHRAIRSWSAASTPSS